MNTIRVMHSPPQSPIVWPGSRPNLTKRITAIFSTYFRRDEYTVLISPFFGGGAVELHLNNMHGYRVIANDIHARLMGFWMSVKFERNELVECLRGARTRRSDVVASANFF